MNMPTEPREVLEAEAREVLLPCPFCGGEASFSQYETESLWSHAQVTYTQIGCDECGYDIATEPGYEIEAPERWNTRPAMLAYREQLRREVVEEVDYAEAARIMFEACRDRFMRPEQCYPAIDALAAAGFISAAAPGKEGGR